MMEAGINESRAVSVRPFRKIGNLEIIMKKLLYILLLCPLIGWSEEGMYPLDTAPDRSGNLAALQNGAKLFVNYCLNCHSAASMRYNRLHDIGLTDDQIKQNLLFAGDKVGDTMKAAISSKDAKAWFGTAPPDLSVIARAKSSEHGPGADYIYTYLRTYYRDDSRPTGWNNLVYPNTAMPHALWELQGVQVPKYVKKKDPHEEGKTVEEFEKFVRVSPGKLSSTDYDIAVADLTAYINYMSEPSQTKRKQLGVFVLIFLGFFFVITWRLNAAYWKDIK